MYLTVLYVRLHCCAKITVKDFISNIAIDFEIIKGEKDKFINHWHHFNFQFCTFVILT